MCEFDEKVVSNAAAKFSPLGAGDVMVEGQAKINQVLSEKRDESVMKDLASGSEMAGNKLASAGFGFTKPLASNKTKEGRAQNRSEDVDIHYFTRLKDAIATLTIHDFGLAILDMQLPGIGDEERTMNYPLNPYIVRSKVKVVCGTPQTTTADAASFKGGENLQIAAESLIHFPHSWMTSKQLFL